MDFFFESSLLLFDEQEVFFRIFADAARVDILVVGQRSLVLARATAISTDQSRLGVRAFVGRVGRQRLIFRTANVTLRKGKGNYRLSISLSQLYLTRVNRFSAKAKLLNRKEIS